MKVPLLDLKAQYLTIKPEVERAVTEVMDSQHFILGPQVQECEKAIAAYSRCAYAVGVSSGTDALLMCLMAEGIAARRRSHYDPIHFLRDGRSHRACRCKARLCGH